MFKELIEREQQTIPTLITRLQLNFSGEKISLTGIERDILLSGLALIQERLNTETKAA